MEPNIPVAQAPVTEPVVEQKPEVKNPLTKWITVFAGLVILAILFSGVYFLGIYQGQNQKPASKTVQIPTLTVTPTPTLTTNWKTFTAQSGVSFKYPTDWNPKETVTPKDSSGFGSRDSVTLTSPNGLVITYGDHIQGLGGGCDPADCPNNHVLKVEPVNIPGYGTLNLVELVVKDGNDSSVIDAQVGLIDPKTYPDLQVGSKKQFGYYVMFNDKDPNKYLDQFSVYVYDSNSKSNQVGQSSNLSQYFTNPEVQAAEKIIKTLEFTDQASQGDESTNWKTYTNDKYGITLKYPAVWFSQDVTKEAPGDHLANIDFFTNGVTPSISTEGHQGNELLNLYVRNNLNGSTVVSQSKDQFLNFQTNNLKNKITTISGLPAAYADGDNKAYYIWYNDKIQLSIFSNDPNVDKTTFERIISTMTITPLP